MSYLIDTNVVVSGLMLPDSTPGRIVAAWSESEFDVVSSPEQLAEIARVLGYPKIRRVLKWDNARIEQFIQRLHVRVEIVDPDSVVAETPRDPDDTPILGALLAAKADFLVTGDRDLLELRDRYPIETPAQFASRI